MTWNRHFGQCSTQKGQYGQEGCTDKTSTGKKGKEAFGFVEMSRGEKRKNNLKGFINKSHPMPTSIHE